MRSENDRIPHSIQGLDSEVDGCEFLLVFDDGNFSEDSTFLLTDWLAHTPRDVLAKNFRTSEDKLQSCPRKSSTSSLPRSPALSRRIGRAKRGRPTTAAETSATCRSPWVTTSRTRIRTAALLGDVPKRALCRPLANQWLASTPRVLVGAHLKIDPEFVAGLSTAKVPVLPK